MQTIDEFREQLHKDLETFIDSDETEISFSPRLGFEQRKMIHIAASRMGLQHFSTGTEPQRYVTVKKPPNFRRKRRREEHKHPRRQSDHSSHSRRQNQNEPAQFVNYHESNGWENSAAPLTRTVSNDMYEPPLAPSPRRSRFDEGNDRYNDRNDRNNRYDDRINHHDDQNDRYDDRTRGDRFDGRHDVRNVLSNRRDDVGDRRSNRRDDVGGNFDRSVTYDERQHLSRIRNIVDNTNDRYIQNNNEYTQEERHITKRRRDDEQEPQTRHIARQYFQESMEERFDGNKSTGYNHFKAGKLIDYTKQSEKQVSSYYDNYFGINNPNQRKVILREKKIYHTHFTEEDMQMNKLYSSAEARPPNVRGRGYVRWGFDLEMDDHKNSLENGRILMEEIRTPPDH